MKNFISVNGKVRELTDEQVNRILSEMKDKKKNIPLSEIAVGETFEIGEHEFIVLEQSGDTTAVIRKEPLPDSRFGDTNNYMGSDVDAVCGKFAVDITSIVEMENIVPHTVDLTANDGLKDYGAITRLASLLTADRYRRYVEILDKFKPDTWWWLSTPFSTKKHDNESWVLCVSPSGCIGGNHYDYGGGGVRPFCILKSTIFVSK